MSLKIKGWARNIPKILGILVGVFVLGCLVKVFIWERIYYAEKEGSLRDQPTTPVIYEEDEVSEEEVTPEKVKTHTVKPDRPRYLTIEKLGVRNARIVEVGLTENGKMGVPLGIFDIGWYNKSDKPGAGGTMLMDGHNNGPTRAGVFVNLGNLVVGDKIVIERGDGVKYIYEVMENKTMNVNEANKYMATMQQSPVEGKESLSLITCAGEWTNVQNTYLSRTMIRAVIVENS